MSKYEIDFNWQIFFPHDWIGEFDENEGEYIFYPKDSDLTIRITPFHAEKNGVLAPKELMETSYLHSISDTAIPFNIGQCTISNFSWTAYEAVENDNDQKVYVIDVGIFADGELLSIGIYSSNKSECNDALQYIKQIVKK